MPGSRTEEIMSFQTKLGSDPAALAPETAMLPASWLTQRVWQLAVAVLRHHAIRRAEGDPMAFSERALKNAGLSCGEVRSAAREVLAVDDLAVWLSRPALS
jgi:hypothetical protein